MTAAIAPSAFAHAVPQPISAPALLNLLVVDDERTVREACREVASSLGYRTTAAESGEQALRMIDGQNVDVVLLDLKLHGFAGLEVLRGLKAHRPEMEVIVVTGSGRTIFEGAVHRSVSAIADSLKERADPELAATALLPVSW